MPTGYTAKVQEGKATFNEFVWNCAHNFLPEAREERMDSRIKLKTKPDEYYQKSYDEAKEALDKALDRTDTEWERLMSEGVKESDEIIQERIKRNKKEYANYKKMLDKVEAWECDPVHEGLKKFMISQLKESVDFDCDFKYIERKRPIITLKEYKKKRIDSLKWSLDYSKKRLEESIENNRIRNEFVYKLEKVIPQPKERK